MLAWIAASVYGLCTLLSLLYTVAAFFPLRPGNRLAPASFFAGWLTGELAPQHLIVLLGLSLANLLCGGLTVWPGQVGLALAALSGLGLAALLSSALASAAIAERALGAGLGADHRDGLSAASQERLGRPIWGSWLLPFRFRDPRVERLSGLSYGPAPANQRGDVFGSLILRSHPSDRARLDIYRPKGVSLERAPVLLQIHGGGWVIGHKQQQGQPLLHRMAASGWVCVAPNYSLGPYGRMPEPVIDLKRALAWTREHIAEYGGDPDFIAITGGSAGGHLAATVALTAGDPALQPGFEEADTRVAACVAMYGIYSFTNRDDTRHNEALGSYLKRWVMADGYDVDPDSYRQVSPLHRLHPDAPPFCVVHGSDDGLAPYDEARAFTEKLREVSRAPVVGLFLPRTQHAFDVFHSPRVARVLDGVQRFLEHVHSAWTLRQARPAESRQKTRV